jgi:DNA-directed RNA polymerase subunit E'/Rpb7
MQQARTRPNQDQNRKIYGVYIQSLLTMKVILPIVEVGKNMKENLEKIISKRNEGKCISEGFIRPGSIKVIRYSSGNVTGQYVEFETVFECMICHPVEGMLIECDVKTITKAGIHAEVTDSVGAVPITAFIARDHHFTDRAFSEIKENAKIVVRVIGTRYELNDPYICVIGKLIEKKEKRQYGGLSKLNILEDDIDAEEYNLEQEPDELESFL